MANEELKLRQDMDPNYTWDLTHMIPDAPTWEATYKEVEALSQQIADYNGKLMDSSENLATVLKLQEDLFTKFHRLYVFSSMTLHQDMGNSDSQKNMQRLSGLEVTVNSKLSFIEPEIMSSDVSVLQDYLNSNSDLATYGHYFENMIRQKEHILPKEMEELMALVGDFSESPSDVFSMFMNADLVLPEITNEEGETVRLTQGNYTRFIKSPNRRVREEAFTKLHQTMKDFRNTLGSIYTSSLKKDVFEMRARHYTSSREAQLSGKNINESVYDNLLEAVNDHLPLLHRYVDLRKKIMGVDELHLYDLYTPLVKDMDEEISFEEAKKIVTTALEPMGEEYLSFLDEGFNGDWIDVYENKGKRSGAYSWGAYGHHPHVLLNFQNNLNHTFTLAHEMGHALHSYYSNATQPYIYHNYPIFLAEVASTVNECLLIQHLLKTTEDKKKRMYLLNYFMENFRTTVFRQTMFAEFEKESHAMMERGDAVTSESLSAMYYDLNRKYYGDRIVVDELIQYEWSRIPHFYTPFYVYQYATGFSSAVTLSNMILNEGDSAVTRYKEFLKSGSSHYPIDTLKAAGVDMNTKQPVEKAFETFKALLEEMESLVD